MRGEDREAVRGKDREAVRGWSGRTGRQWGEGRTGGSEGVEWEDREAVSSARLNS